MKFNIRTKVIVAISILLIFVLGLTDSVWFVLIRPILTSRLQESQQQIGYRAGDRVQAFLDAKIRALILHSQSAAFLTQNSDLEKIELVTLLTQDTDITNISLISQEGLERIALTRDGEVPPEKLKDRRQSPSYLATTFRYGKEYISEVTFLQNKPTLTIAVPITVPLTRQRLTDLTTGSMGMQQTGDVLGVLEVVVGLDHLFDELTVLGTKETGNVYVVDRNGYVIAHTDKSLTTGKVNFQIYPPVAKFQNMLNSRVTEVGSTTLTNPLMEYTDEHGQPVLGTFVTVPKASWAVIIQQPRSLALADFTRVTLLALGILIAGLIAGAPISYLLMRKFTDPIQQLMKGAQQYGEGRLDYQVTINTHDELSDLANAFSQMAVHLDTSRKKLQQDKDIISAERNKLAVILSGIYDAVVAVDAQRQIILLNATAQELIGFTEEEVLGRPIDGIITLLEKEKVVSPEIYCALRPTQSSGVIWTQKNITMISSRKKETNVNMVSSQIQGGNAVGVGCILTIHDITKEVKFEKMKLDFVSMAAHELRTPLTAIRGYADILIDQAKSELTVDHYTQLAAINDSAKKLAGLIDNLLNVSKIERGTFNVQQIPMDLIAIARSGYQEIKMIAENRKQTILFTEPSIAHAWVLVDAVRITEVFANLLENAVNYTPVGGKITISIEDQPDCYLVRVTDTGHGIPQDALPYLFTKFYRVSGGLEQGSKGTGLGLYVSKSIIDLHKGKIWAESEVGHGTTMSFTLPKLSLAEVEEINRRQAQSAGAHLPAGIIRNANRLPPHMKS